MVYRTSHISNYTYADPVATCHNEVRLVPRVFPNQRLLSNRITIEPEPEVFAGRTDYFGNHVDHFSILEPHTSLTISASCEVEVIQPVAIDPEATMPWEEARNLIRTYPDSLTLEAFEYTCESPFVPLNPEIGDYAAKSFPKGKKLLASAIDMRARVFKDFKYLPKSTTIDTPVEQVYRTRKGVCQDFAHVMIAGLRALGLAARYVSGYLRSGANYTGAEASHAWVSIYTPRFGWVDLDPTNNVNPGEGHVTVAWGRDYGDVTPVKGVNIGGGEHEVTVQVRVRQST